MNMRFVLAPLIVSVAGLLAAQDKPAPPEPTTALASPAEKNPFSKAEEVVKALYDLVSVRPRAPQTDWEKVRALFYKDAVIVLRTTPRTTAVFSVQGFIDDFIAFNQRARVKERGFSEKVLRLKPMVFQDIAHVLVLYEASIPGSSRPPQQGIDSFHLMKKEGRWWIVSVLNEVPAAGASLPAELQP